MLWIDYKQFEYGCRIYVRSLDNVSFIFLLCTLYGWLIASNHLHDVNELKCMLGKGFEMKDCDMNDLDPAKNILEMEIHNKRSIVALIVGLCW